MNQLEQNHEKIEAEIQKNIEARTELVAQERLVSLGSLAAGIAHDPYCCYIFKINSLSVKIS